MLRSRQGDAGFTMLEAIIAVAVLAVLGVSILSSFTRTATQPRLVQLRYDVARFADSQLEEYIHSHPAMSMSGTYGDRWSWEIRETPEDHLQPNRYEDLIDLVRVTIIAKEMESDVSFELSEVTTRAAK